MGDSIPDEILSEILSPALRVSDEVFSVTSETGRSPFLSMSESSSAFLLVSKAWLRVATPLLYNVVVLRSKAQAQALAAVLTSNPALGKFVRKLRVEGGYAISMLKILQTSPNITDIFLTLDIVAPDNPCGLCRGLQLIDPVCVIIHFRGMSGRISLETEKLVKKVETCIPTWTKMAVFKMQCPLVLWRTFSSISVPLSTAPNLVTLWVPNDSWFLDLVRRIATNPSLRRVRVIAFDSLSVPARRSYIKKAKEDERMFQLFDFPDERALEPEDIPPPPFIYPARFAADPAQEDAIWSRVLYFALCRPPPNCNHWQALVSTRRTYMAPLLVSKKFARLGIPHLYTNPALHWLRGLHSFADRLSQNPPLGDHVRCLTIVHSGDLDLFRAIISRTPTLVELYGGFGCLPITWKAFNDLVDFTGSTLSSFEGVPISKPSSRVSPAVFKLFPRMRSFGWSSPTRFKTGSKLIPDDAFSNLVQLEVDDFDPSFLEVLSGMELPSLRSVFFSATAPADGGVPFFQKHGRKLKELAVSVLQIADPDLAIFHNCPSVTNLSISCDETTILSTDGFSPTDPHTHLERILFKLPAACPFNMRQNQRNALGRFLSSLDVTPFPALRQIEHPLCSWPTSEREIARSQWVRWAESLLGRNIQLVDSKGTHWRPRLKYVPRG
ncbi:hypothetical protein B0H19DRAFT_1105878 [Mycena capillaripes]|nr:hypothetical protein B0H19DRAFT_1105878 [Mycena capillaripes]